MTIRPHRSRQARRADFAWCSPVYFAEWRQPGDRARPDGAARAPDWWDRRSATRSKPATAAWAHCGICRWKQITKCLQFILSLCLLTLSAWWASSCVSGSTAGRAPEWRAHRDRDARSHVRGPNAGGTSRCHRFCKEMQSKYCCQIAHTPCV